MPSTSAAIEGDFVEARVPPGFELLPLCGGFQQSFGPVYMDRARSMLGFRVKPNHLNFAGALHGGALAAFGDMQVVVVRGRAGTLHDYSPTISITTDCLAPGRLDDWIEAAVSLAKETGSMLFTNAVISTGGEVIARSSAIYRKVKIAR